MQLTVASLRRYPVKSMGGEPLERAVLDDRGLAGDRWYAVTDGDGRLASGKNSHRFRRRDRVFDYAAGTGDSSAVVVTGPGGRWAVGDPALDEELTRVMGSPVAVTAEHDVPHQDAGAVSLVTTATLAWCADRWGIDPDPRRLRVNIVVSAEEPFVEESWIGRELTLGSARLRVAARIQRCRTIDLDQDGAVASGRWLGRLADERDLCVATYADVASPGVIGVGDRLTVR